MSNLTGQTLGERYLIRRLLASGGMASVYVADDTRLDREVAIKVVHPHLAESYRERFVAEAKLAARLQHPNLVNVFDQGRDDQLAWMAMEYVSGITLRDVMDKFHVLDAERALELFEPVLAGLASAHKAGILHRDLKPENVLLADDGRIKLSDWGLAREVDQRTKTESLIGTVAYVSPELVLRGSADARSDVYAAGILLFELVTGRQPFVGEQAVQVAFQHANSTVPAPSTVNPAVPPLVDELVLWATAREPAHRPTDAGELLAVVSRARAELRNSGDLSQTTALAHTQRLAATTKIGDLESLGFNDANVTERIAAPGSVEVDPTAGAGAATEVIGGYGDDLATLGIRATSAKPAGGIHGNQTERISLDQLEDDELHPLERLEKPNPALKLLIISTALVLLGSAVGWFFSSGPGAFKSIPVLAGQSQSSAESTLGAIHLDYQIVTENNKEVATGQVIRSEPAAGQLAFGQVKVFVSLGPKQIRVPEIKGQNLVDATASLVGAGLELGAVSSWFDNAALGTVYDYTGADGSAILDGTKIDLKLSLGPIPLVSGMDASLANSTLSAVGLVVADTKTEYSETVAKGKVITIQTAQGQPIGKGAAVTLVVSKGSAMVTMPKVVGETILAAKTLLENLGIRVIVNTNQLQSNWGVAKVKSASANVGAQIDVTKTSVTINSK
ncbi:MAG: protein kinase [Actinomycetales bacterium]|nr:protein kinase [Actinomycetales bacterium]